VRTIATTVRAIFGAAVRDRLIAHDPCTRLALPAVQRQPVVPLTIEQVEALVEALPERYRALAVVGAGTGLRQGELFGLQVADVDFFRRVVHVERQVQPVAGGGVAVAPLKNRAAHRAIPVGNVVVTALAEHLRKYPAAGDGFVFTGPAASPLNRGAFNGHVWRPARRRAGLHTVGMHELRHFYASALIAAGQSVKVVSARLGHTNAAMTLNTYAHLWPDDEDRTRTAIDDVFRRHVPRVRPGKEA
jgi:integrase